MKISGEWSVSAFLRIILEIIFIIGIFIGAFSVFALIITMINPDSPINHFTMTQGYELFLKNIENEIQISSLDPGVYNLEIKPLAWISYKTKNRGFLLLFWSCYFIYLGIGLTIVMQLRNFLSSLSEGSPFHRTNAKRIMNIGWLIIITTISRLVWMFIAVFYMKKVIVATNARMFLHPSLVLKSLNLEPIFVGLIVVIIAEIFRQGVKLKEEQELTI